MTPSLEQEIMRVYRASNQAFAQAIGTDLGEYGYY